MYTAMLTDLAHGLRDDLWTVVSVLEQLSADPDLSSEGQALIEAATLSVEQAAERLNTFGSRVTRFVPAADRPRVRLAESTDIVGFVWPRRVS